MKPSAAPANAKPEEEASPAAAAAAPTERQRLSTLPAFGGRYDPVKNATTKVFGPVMSESGNCGWAFSTPVSGAEKVVAVVLVNNATAAASRKPTVEAIARGENPKPAEPRILVRGAILQGLGVLGAFDGIDRRATPEERAEKIALLRNENAKLANLVENHGAILDVYRGEQHSFLNSVTIPVGHLPAVIKDLCNTNTARNTPHAGATRLAFTIDAARVLLQQENLIPKLADGPLAENRYKPATPAAAPAVHTEPEEDEPPF